MRRFLLACGGVEPIRLRLRSTRNPESYSDHDFDQPYVLIGNRADADLNVIHPNVEPRHLLLHLFHGRIFVLNLATAPVRFPQQTSRGEGWLARGERIGFADFTLEILSEQTMRPGEARMPSPTQLPTHAGRELVCEALDIKSANSVFRIRRDLVLLGNSRRAKIILMIPSVSSIHCAFVRTVLGYWVINLCGRGGVLLDGRRIQCAQITDGSLIQVGSIRFRLAYQKSSSNTQDEIELGVPSQLINPLEASQTNLSAASERFNSYSMMPPIVESESRQADPSTRRNTAGSDLETIPSSEVVESRGVVAKTEVMAALPPRPNEEQHALAMPSQEMSRLFTELQESIRRQFQQTIDQMLAVFRSMLESQLGQMREEFERVLQKVVHSRFSTGTALTSEELPFAELISDVVQQMPVPDPKSHGSAAPPDLHLWFMNQLKGLTGRS